MSKLVQRPELMYELLSNLVECDLFLARLVKVSKQYHAYEKRQTIQMCVLRCDYMIDWPCDRPKLVEYNTVAVSFGVFAELVVKV